jgi:vitamin B12 transporter
VKKRRLLGRAVVFSLTAAFASGALADGEASSATNGVSSLGTVVVWGRREQAPAVHDAPWSLAGSSSVSVRGQGECGTLNDLSINGSAFSEAGLVFNGATVRNAQTEHFNSDLPAPADWMARPRVLTGLGLFRAVAGHPAGSLVVALDDHPERGGKATLGIGLNGLVFGRVSDLEVFDVGEAGRAWVGAFGEAARADKTDGYDSNPMSRAAVGGRFGFGAENWSFDALLSWQWRDFGCTGAYGANEKYPAWEEDQTSLASATWRYDAGDDQASEVSVLWTRGRDAYWLYRDRPDFYENTHLSDSVTLHGATRRHFADWAFVDLRGDFDTEVYSTMHHNNYTGSSPKTKRENFRRFHGSVAALPGVRLGDWEISVGAAGEFYSAYEHTCAPAGGVAYWLAEDQKIELSYREGCRMPSYTELTYDSPDSKGTKDLPLQRTRSVNLDWTWEETARLGFFYLQSENLVDWLKTGSSSAWTATALDPVHTFGLSGDAEWRATDALAFIPRGAVILKQTSTDYWASRYAMDYPIAAVSLEATYRILEGWRVSYRQGVEVWKKNNVRRGSRVRNVSRVETTFEVPGCEGLEVALGLSDLFNQAFEVYPGQRALGFNGYLTVTYRW